VRAREREEVVEELRALVRAIGLGMELYADHGAFPVSQCHQLTLGYPFTLAPLFNLHCRVAVGCRLGRVGALRGR